MLRVKTPCGALGMKSICFKNVSAVDIKMFGDLSAMTGTLDRKVSGMVKHLEVRYIAAGNVVLLKGPQGQHLADALTHYRRKDGTNYFAKMCGQQASDAVFLREDQCIENRSCMREPGECPHLVTRVQWADQRFRAKGIVGPRSLVTCHT